MTTEERAALLPCPNPWCKESKPTTYQLDDDDYGLEKSDSWIALCSACDQWGPVKGSEAEAITAWNTRPTTGGEGLREALQPFVEELQNLDETDKDHWPLYEHHVGMNITVGHVRAIAALAQGGEADDGVAGGWEIEGSVYEDMEAAISGGEPRRTIAHVPNYADALTILAALSPTADGTQGQDVLRDALVEIIGRCETFEHINLIGRSVSAKEGGTLRRCLDTARKALKGGDK